MLLEKIYAEEGQGVAAGKLADTIHAMNEEMGIGEPRTILVQNLDPKEQTHDSIAPSEYGVTNKRNWSKYFKRVNVKAKEEASTNG